MKLVAILSLAVVRALAQCSKYVCDSKDLPWGSNYTCGMQDPETASQFDIRNCPPGSFCQGPSGGSDLNCFEFTPTAYSMYPGEPCDETFSCRQGVCTNGNCPSLALGDVCVNIYDCGSDLTCSNGKCVKLAPVGSPCSQSTDCVQNAGCAASPQGTCVAYLSVAPQSQAPGCTAPPNEFQYNSFCVSTFCYLNSDNEYMCSDVLPNSQPAPYNCTDKCTSLPDSKSGMALNGFCICSFGGGGRYCEQFPGDPLNAKYTQYTIDFLSSQTIKGCNTVRNQAVYPIEYTSPCNQLLKHLSDEQKAISYRAFWYAEYYQADECVVEIMTRQYFRYGRSSWPLFS